MRKLRCRDAKSLAQGDIICVEARIQIQVTWHLELVFLATTVFSMLTEKALLKTHDWESDDLSFISSLSLIRYMISDKSRHFSEPQLVT